ncbi:glycosyltransferase [Actinophytocola sp.]|uniref:glycosyltransferase n=1 Tax=Actinophytocola sp. TaxID=1872138 RepID=UPI003D6C1194
MRVLVTSTSGAGHYGPLAPFVRSLRRGGHDVLVAAPDSLRPSVRDAEFWPVADPPAEELAAAHGRLAGMSHDEANAWIVGEVFARLDATAALPRIRDAITSWRPDVVVRETAEFAGAVAADLHGVPHARVAIGLASLERMMVPVAAPQVDTLRAAHGLPGPHSLDDEPHLTLFPAGLEDPLSPGFAHTARFRDPSWVVSRPGARPFVYVTFGSVAGGIPALAEFYAAALAAVAGLDADVLLTVGRHADPASFGPVPGHVRVERWVDQASVLERASAVVCHGGGGSTLGALAASVPLVVVPLFAGDQHINARRVAAAGAGLVASPPQIRAALSTVLTDASYRVAAAGLAAELAAHPSTDEAADVLAAYWSGVDR